MKLNRKSPLHRIFGSSSNIESSNLRADTTYNVIVSDDDPSQHCSRVPQDDLADDKEDKDGGRLHIKPLEMKTMHQATWLSSIVNFSSTLLGAGILGVPYAISLMGWIPGLCALLFSAACSFFGLHLMAECALQLPAASSFYSVAQLTIPEFATLVDVLITIKGFGTVTAYILVIADSITLAFQSSSYTFLKSRFWVISLSYLIIGPLSYFPSLDSLKFSSAISLVMMCVLTVMIVIYAMHFKHSLFDPCPSPSLSVATADSSACAGEHVAFTGNFMSFLRAFPIMLFGFTCQQNAFTVVNELKDPSRKRLNSIFFVSIGSSWLVNMVVGCCGYATFGSMTKSDILRNYPENALTSTCRVLMAMVIMCHYPLQLHPSRRTALSLWQRFLPTPNTATTTTVNTHTHTNTVSSSNSNNNLISHSTNSSSSNRMVSVGDDMNSPAHTHAHSSSDSSSNSSSTTTSTGLLHSHHHHHHHPLPHNSHTAVTTTAVDAKVYQRRFFAYTTFFNIVVYLIGISVQDLGIVLSLMGATMSCLVILLLPGMFYYRLALKLLPTETNTATTTTTSTTTNAANHSDDGSENHENNKKSTLWTSFFYYLSLPPSLFSLFSPHTSSSTAAATASRTSFSNHRPWIALSPTSTTTTTMNRNNSISSNSASNGHNSSTNSSSNPLHEKRHETTTDNTLDEDDFDSSMDDLVDISFHGSSSSSHAHSYHGTSSSSNSSSSSSSSSSQHNKKCAVMRCSDDVMPGIRWKRYLALSLFGLGILVLCLSVTSVLYTASTSSSAAAAPAGH